jgi:hypothetical protein
MGNMEESKILKVFEKGKDECEHEWVYDSKFTAMYTIPAEYMKDRVCEHCGRKELIIDSKLQPIGKNEKDYNFTLEKFKK